MAITMPAVPLAGYTLLKQEDEGGFAAVHCATADSTGEEVAIKLFFKGRGNTAANERKVLERIGMHKNVVTMVDVTRDEHGVEALVLDYLGGGTLIDLVRSNGWFDPDTVIEQKVFRVWRDVVLG